MEFLEIFRGMKALDLFTMTMLSFPFLVLYLSFTVIYFTLFDKRVIKNADFKRHGLSRFIFICILFMFGLILFNLIIEFISAFIYEINKENIKNFIILKSISDGVKILPNNILINFTIIATGIYTGTEGLISNFKTMKLDNGIPIELPAIKRRRLSIFFLIWAYLAIISTIYYNIVGTSVLNFDIFNIYTGLGTTLVILFYAERSSSIISSKQEKIKSIDISKINDPSDEIPLDIIGNIQKEFYNNSIAIDIQNTKTMDNGGDL